MKKYPHEEESVLKPLSWVAELIDALPMENFVCLMVNLSNLSSQPYQPDPCVIIGVND